MALVEAEGGSDPEGIGGIAVNDSGAIVYERYSQKGRDGFYVWKDGVVSRPFDLRTLILTSESGWGRSFALNNIPLALDFYAPDCTNLPTQWPPVPQMSFRPQARQDKSDLCPVMTTGIVRVDTGVATLIAAAFTPTEPTLLCEWIRR